jgi:hypothetical protein
VILPESTAQFYTTPDVAHRLVADLAPQQVALAYEANRNSAELRAIAQIVREQYPEAAARIRR